jgi:hypothetical protein
MHVIINYSNVYLTFSMMEYIHKIRNGFPHTAETQARLTLRDFHCDNADPAVTQYQ